MKNVTKFFATILSLIMLLSLLVSPAIAGDETASLYSSIESEASAQALYKLGLFKGTDNGFELEKTPTRIQGLIMLIRLLGEEEAALSYSTSSPFTDVASWAAPYVAYGFEQGYTLGTGESTFSPDTVLNAKSYATFLLRALGYNDSEGDFTWDKALSFSASKNLMTTSSASLLENAVFNRGDMADLSLAALTMPLKGSSQTLAQKLIASGVFTQEAGNANGVLGAHVPFNYVPYTPAETPSKSSAVKYESSKYYLASGTITADVVTVDLNNPAVTVKSAMVNNTIGATASFKSIVAQSGAAVVINGNFFEAYQSFKVPIGSVVCNGNFLYGVSGLSALAITTDNKVMVGRPAFFYRVAVSGNATKNWSCYELNSITQDDNNAVVYTPAYGTTLPVTYSGTYVIVKDGVVTELGPCSKGASLTIPTNGFIMWMGNGYTSTSYYYAPEIGDRVTLTPYLINDEEGFRYENVVSLVSGAPRLVTNGAIETYLEPGYTEARFTTASTPRTAIGTLSNGKLVLVSVAGATIQQMRELMLELGCVDAINHDGGASTGLYVNGSYVRSPSRELTVTLQVFVN